MKDRRSYRRNALKTENPPLDRVRLNRLILIMASCWRRLSYVERDARRLGTVWSPGRCGLNRILFQETMMRFYQATHSFYCGVDLHARTMHVCVVDAEGQTQEHVNLQCDPGRFLKVIQPYREQFVCVANVCSRGTGWRICVARKGSRSCWGMRST